MGSSLYPSGCVKTMALVLNKLLILQTEMPDSGKEAEEIENAELPDDITLTEIAQVKEAYRRAVEAFYWFEVTTMPLGSYSGGDSSTIEADGMMYAKVRHDTIRTYADLENYLLSLFAEDIVSRLLGGTGIQRYRDFNGELYAIDADRGLLPMAYHMNR
jgi:hypothetical protein